MAPQALWIHRPAPNPTASLRLYCAPYAGGGTGVFRTWPADLDGRIEVRSILYPGRERRFPEPPLSSVEALAERLVPAMLAELDPPFALFGHSLGALVAFEVARRLAAGGRAPVHLLVSGTHAPHLTRGARQYHRLPDAEFLRAIQKLGGTPPELVDNRELLDLLLPALRADFTAAETYERAPGHPLPCPITAFGGTDDPLVDRPALEGWAAHTAAGFRLHELPGDHFFPTTARAELLQLVNQELTPYLAGR
ncbi:MAG TPA: alpha/beta fold hydrolase [Candidatus Dormibacteraeota bacterium]|nr:alpha/beta fold hydrolase [Candidatus Dormibacteraeota bacterium]